MLKILIPYDPTIPALTIYLPNRIACKYAPGYSTYIFIRILLKPRWEQATCPSTAGWINRFPYSHKENMLQQWKWTNSNYKQQEWISQAQYWITEAAPNKYILQSPLIWNPNTGKTHWWGQKSRCGYLQERESVGSIERCTRGIFQNAGNVLFHLGPGCVDVFIL